MKNRRKTKIGVNVPLGRSNPCANFQLQRSKIKGQVDGRTTCQHWTDLFLLFETYSHWKTERGYR